MPGAPPLVRPGHELAPGALPPGRDVDPVLIVAAASRVYGAGRVGAGGGRGGGVGAIGGNGSSGVRGLHFN